MFELVGHVGFNTEVVNATLISVMTMQGVLRKTFDSCLICILILV